MDIAADERIWTIASLLEWSNDYFSRHAVDAPRLTAELLLGRVLGLRRIDLYLKFDMVLTVDELASYKALFRRRLGHEPLQYILGETEFMGLRLQVDRRVLIPRPETEVLVETVSAHATTIKEPRILDIGTGSGNIPISLASRIPGAHIVSVDISEDALEVARSNCRLHGCESRVTLLRADILTAGPDAFGPPFDIVVSNPPYISEQEFAEVEAEVRDHEPRMATTDDADGLTFHRAIIDRARSWLANGGWLALEVAYGQAPTVAAFCTGAGYGSVGIARDLSGIDRIVTAGWKS
jgi:release factor glutamine methyltransferase